jgi:hypothetical protein
VANSIDNTVSILLGHNGIFTVNQTAPVLPRPLSVALGQFFADGKIDLAVANRDADSISILKGDGSGEFVPIDIVTPNSPASVVVADFNHDGNQDLAVGNEDDSLSVYPGTGNGLGNPTALNGGSAPTGGPAFPAVADFNRDGNLDLAVANEGANTVSVLNGDGNGGFAAPVSLSVGQHPLATAVGDFNGDGAPDLVAVNQGDNTVGILLNQYYHTTTTLSASSNPALPGQLVTIQATVSPDVPQSTLPTGVVTFMDGETILGTGTVPANGIVSLVNHIRQHGFPFPVCCLSRRRLLLRQ